MITTTGLQKMEAKQIRLSLSRMGDIVLKGVKDNFINSRNADGSGMRPLHPLTILWKRKMGARQASKPLIFTEQLMNSMEKRELNKNQGQVSMKDKVRGKLTNIGILDINKRRGRAPFGILISPLRDYVKSILEAQ